MSLFADLLGTVSGWRYVGAAARDDRPLPALCDALMDARDEVTGMELARRILDRYAAADEPERLGFFRHLVSEMDVDVAVLRRALDAYAQGATPESYGALAAAAEAPRQELARRLNRVPGATARLVAMRADLLRLAKDHPDLARFDHDLRHLFSSWFNRGFLVLRRIDWESPANVLQRIIAYEAVHEIAGWDDLRRRLEPPDRRCFAFFHPVMPDEPLIFVEVALTRGIPHSVTDVLAEGREPVAEDRADTAVFYSISNCQAGLAGISFGNSLIKQVVADLSAALPHLRSFVTLSPIPGLADWIAEEGLREPAGDEALRRMAARYLLTAKGRGGRPRDPVARFHLGNGAAVHDVIAGADGSAQGRIQSLGAMVNYLYDPARIAANLEAGARGEVPAARRVAALARAPLPASEDA